MSRRALLAQALGLSFGLGALGFSRRAEAARLEVGKPAPALILRTLDGQSIASNALTGKVVILTFWATWCEPCRAELPLLSAFAERHAREGLQVLGFSLDSPADMADVKQVAAGLSFPVGLLGSAYAGDYGRVWHLPVNFTIDRSGRLADNGWDDDVPTWTEERLQRIVMPLIRAA
jgi:thiol-disulfide isomerase/thioredoxin